MSPTKLRFALSLILALSASAAFTAIAAGATTDAAGRGAPTTIDVDGDGVPDATDVCVVEPGPVANDGCPEPAVDEVACTKAEAKVERAKARVRTLKSRDAPEKKVNRAKRKLAGERAAARDACAPPPAA